MLSIQNINTEEVGYPTSCQSVLCAKFLVQTGPHHCKERVKILYLFCIRVSVLSSENDEQKEKIDFFFIHILDYIGFACRSFQSSNKAEIFPP